MKGLITGCVLALAACSAAHAETRDLVAALQEDCKPAPGLRVGLPGAYGTTSMKSVQKALYAEFPLGDFAIGQSAQDLAQRAMTATPGPPSQDPKVAARQAEDAQLLRYRRVIEVWSSWPQTGGVVATLEEGGVWIDATEAGGVDTQTRLARLFTADDTGLRVVCRNPAADEPQSEPSPQRQGQSGADQPTLSIVKTAGDLGEGDLEKKTFAEFSYSDNRDTRVQAWAVKLAAGLQWSERLVPSEPNGRPYLTAAPLAFVAFDRAGDNDPSEEGYVNNLDFGVQLGGRLGMMWGEGPAVGYYRLTGRYQTDDKLESAIYAAELRLVPPLPPIKHHRVYEPLWNGGSWAVDLKWKADLVADWIEVSDAGEKTALVDKAEYVRLGYDADLALRVGPSASDRDWRLLLSARYALRDGQTQDGGDAQWFTGGLAYLPSDDANWSFGLTYERGETLESFERAEIWRLAVGYRY